MEKLITWVLSTLTGIAFFLYGNNPVAIQWLYILISLVVADLVFGSLNAVSEKKFTRRILLDGVKRKLGELFIIAIGHLLDTMNVVQGAINLQQATTGFLIAYEAMSVLSQIKVGGTPIPSIIPEAIKKMLGKYSDTKGGGNNE